MAFNTGPGYKTFNRAPTHAPLIQRKEGLNFDNCIDQTHSVATDLYHTSSRVTTPSPPPPPPHLIMSEAHDDVGTSRESTPMSQLRTPRTSTSPASPEQGAQDEYMPVVLKLSKSKGADALNRYYMDDEDGMYFRNFTDAATAMDHTQWHPPANDDTIPQNDEQDREIVRRLVEAFLDTSGAMDTEGNAYRKRLTPGTNVFYDPWTIERCAWEILHMAKSMHINGFTAPVLDMDILKCIGQTENWTFENRIIMICRVLKISKSVAVSLMKHEKVWTTIGAPHKLYNSTLVNTHSNAFRNKWVKAGRAAEKATVPNDDNSPGLSVKKRKRANKVTPIRGSSTFAPSPLANGGSTANEPTASVFNAFTSINNNTTPGAPITYATTSSITSINSINSTVTTPSPAASSTPTHTANVATEDVEMADAAPDSVPPKPSQAKVTAQGSHNTSSTSNIMARQSTQGFTDIDMDNDAKPQRPAADVDAAEMLLGLRRPS